MTSKKPFAILSVLSRIAAAVVGGYGLASAAAIAGAGLLPMPRADAVLAATLPAYAVHAVAAVWAFGARTAWSAWAGILIPAAILAALAMLARLTP